MDCLLGIDVGSTSMKALVYDLDGNVISRGSRPTESIANDPDHPNWQVYLPDHIWDGIASAIHDAVSQIGPQNRIVAAAVTGLGAVREQHHNLNDGWKMLDWKEHSRSPVGSLSFGALSCGSSG
jgi:sugar (pentulose or hexulose) kinase